MYVLVTGGCGFIGYHLTRKLQVLGHRVLVIDPIDNEVSAARSRRLAELPNVVVEWGFVEEYGIYEGIDAVVHLAGRLDPKTSWDMWKLDFDRNVRPSVYVAMEYGVRRKLPVVYASTIVYGVIAAQRPSEGTNVLCTESITSPYVASKLCGEAYMHLVSRAGSRAVTLRLNNVYGEGQDPKKGVIPLFRQQLEAGENLKIRGGSQRRDLIHVDDVVDIMISAIVDDSLDGVYNVGTGVSIPVLRVAEMLCDFFGVGHDRIDIVEEDPNGFDVVVNTDRLVKDFGKKTFVSLRDGLAEIL